jgi:GT2 family glycosyltransferase
MTASRVNGKFLDVDGERFLVKGVTYGTFAPDAHGLQFPVPVRIDQDFAQMAAHGINTVRVYTVPPDALLDAAARHGLRVIAGLPWPQHIAFLDSPDLERDIRREAAATVERLGCHPALLMFAVGNEIPPSVVRWHGQRRVERFLRELYADAKSASPSSLITYVNFPPTEYFDLSCFDLYAFNVYLHREADLRAYLVRLQHIAGAKPLLLAEAGADSIRETPDGQARLTATHIRAAFAEGACGAVAFAWTDEWWRGGSEITDWAFGLVDAERRPKPALETVARAFADAPFSASDRAGWPTVSVVVCAYNAADSIDDCLTSLDALTYPNAEVIVVNDGSRDDTGAIARRHGNVKVIDVPNGGLSAARNIGLSAATGEIVAYTDADVRVDPDWLTYLVQPMLTSRVVGSGGPNIVPADDPFVAQCVARAPGGPTHVLFDDRIAEHVPGCNMAFRRDALLSIGGFNPVYLRAGDDVDICWRLQGKGLRIGFAPAALVWHHHRTTVKAYWRQQVGYGEGETWLAAHHPDKFVSGQMLWRGRIYSPLPFLKSFSSQRVNAGVWGTAAFPSVYATDAHLLQFLPHSPAWMATCCALIAAGAVGLVRHVEAGLLPLVVGATGWSVTIARCGLFARQTDLRGLPPLKQCTPAQSHRRYQALIALLHLLQPLARVRGRIRGLSLQPQVVAPEHVTRLPWDMPVPAPQDVWTAAPLFVGGEVRQSFWSEAWVAQTAILSELTGVLRASRPTQLVDVGDGWRADRDLSLTIGRWGWLHVKTLVEEHEQGRCLLRVGMRLRPSFSGVVQTLTASLILVGVISAALALSLHRPSVIAVSIAAVAALAARVVWQATRTAAVLRSALTRVAGEFGLMPLPTEPAGTARVAHPEEAQELT